MSMAQCLSLRTVFLFILAVHVSGCATGMADVTAADVPRLQQAAAASPDDLDLRTQDRNDDGFDAGSGWILRGGVDLPLRLFTAFDFFPRIRGLFGQLTAEGGARKGLWGIETGATIRFR